MFVPKLVGAELRFKLRPATVLGRNFLNLNLDRLTARLMLVTSRGTTRY
jgi:hypothetical protein